MTNLRAIGEFGLLDLAVVPLKGGRTLRGQGRRV